MFVSLIQALGVDSTFFIQLLIFLLFYPVLSRLLFLPYFKLQNQREKETVERMKKVTLLEQEKKRLKEKNKERTHKINETFNRIYGEESKVLRESFLKRQEKKQQENKNQYEQKIEDLLQEIKTVEGQLHREVNQLAEVAVGRLTS